MKLKDNASTALKPPAFPASLKTARPRTYLDLLELERRKWAWIAKFSDGPEECEKGDGTQSCAIEFDGGTSPASSSA